MQKLKKPVSILLAVIMVVSLFTIIPTPASAAEAVEYIYRWWDADAKEVKQETRTCTQWTNIRERSSDDLAPGWYYFDQPTSLSNGERLFIRSGTVNIILKDGKMLDIDEGIGVEPGATLNIFGQAEDNGYLVCGTDVHTDNAAIGGTIEDENDSDPNAGDINIYGGKVQAGYGSTTSKGAGVGGAANGSPSRVTIYGGNHTFRRYGSGAGLGGGYKGWVSNYSDEGVTGEGIRIYGGTITAESAQGAGIGNGYYADAAPCSIAIYGGNISALSTDGGAGIGGGRAGRCPYIHIYGGNVTAVASGEKGESGAGIGGGEDEGVGTIIIRGESTVTGVGGRYSNARGIGHGAYDSFVSFFTRYYPSNGNLYFPETSFVKIGLNQNDTTVVPASYIYEHGRGFGTKYMSIYPCPHENLYSNSSNYYHGMKCSYCQKPVISEEHTWGSDNKCTFCGASAVTVTYTFKEQDRNGNEVTRNIQIPEYSSFTMPEAENVPDGMEFVGWTGDTTIRYAGDVIDSVDMYMTYTAVYEAVVETTYIDEDGEQQTVLARKFPITESEAGPLYSGWYVIDEDIPEDFGSRAEVYGDVKLILADDVTVSSRFLYFEESAFIASSLSVYGQAKQTGTISCDFQGYGPITGFTQYGGKVNVDKLQADNCKIAGGVFDAHLLEVSDKIELGWSGWSDSITVYDYRYNNTNPEISVIEGKQLKNNARNTVYNPGVLTDNQIKEIRNVPLVPAVNYKFTGPTWSWSEDRTEATATFTDYRVKPEVRASIERTLDGVYMVSTASVYFMGETYSNTVRDQVRWCVNNNTNDTSVHGTVEFSADIAEPGELVEITATPNKNYYVKSVNIRPAKSSKTVEIIGDGEAFIMPDCDVSVDVVFEQTAPSPVTIHTTGNGTVTANVDKALEDDEITLNISPGENYRLGSISAVADGDAEKVKLTALSGDGEGDQGYAKLLDNSPYTKWCIGVTEPRHIIMKADAPVFMTGYSLTTGNDNSAYRGRNWKDYTIYGANFASDSEAVRDSAQWQVVKAVVNDSVTQDVNYTTFDYTLDTPAAAYQYYKIEITSNKGGSSIQMSEFEMKAAALQQITLSGEGNTRTFTMPVDPVTVNAEFVPCFTGHSLSLNGDIGVNFYLNLTDQEITDGATVDFVWTVNGADKTLSVTLTADDKRSCGYKASCPVAVAEMTYSITATLSIGNETIATDTYSAVEYADVILTDTDFISSFTAKKGEEKYQQLSALVKSMLNYGAKAQKQFHRNEDNLADEKLNYDDGSPYYFVPGINTADKIPAEGSDMADGLTACGLEYVGTTLLYLSQTSMRHYYKITDQTKFDLVKDNITFNGEKVDYTVKGDKIYFELKNISASNLDTLYTLTIGESSYRYSALDYVKACLLSDKTTYNMQILAKATYIYNQAANAYFGS